MTFRPLAHKECPAELMPKVAGQAYGDLVYHPGTDDIHVIRFVGERQALSCARYGARCTSSLPQSNARMLVAGKINAVGGPDLL